MSVLVGLSVGHLTQGTIIANLGFGDTRFPAPVRHGDTIYGETVILEKRLSTSRPGQGIVSSPTPPATSTATSSRPRPERRWCESVPPIPRSPDGAPEPDLRFFGPAWLFCPADRPERFQKAAAAADVVILDLEDGVAAKDREAARAALIDTPLNPDRTVVRINPTTTADHEPDLEALSRTKYTTVMLAKTEIRNRCVTWRRWTWWC